MTCLPAFSLHFVSASNHVPVRLSPVWSLLLAISLILRIRQKFKSIPYLYSVPMRKKIGECHSGL